MQIEHTHMHTLAHTHANGAHTRAKGAHTHESSKSSYSLLPTAASPFSVAHAHHTCKGSTHIPLYIQDAIPFYIQDAKSPAISYTLNRVFTTYLPVHTRRQLRPRCPLLPFLETKPSCSLPRANLKPLTTAAIDRSVGECLPGAAGARPRRFHDRTPRILRARAISLG
jgi:hypothetical protein